MKTNNILLCCSKNSSMHVQGLFSIKSDGLYTIRDIDKDPIISISRIQIYTYSLTADNSLLQIYKILNQYLKSEKVAIAFWHSPN